MSSREPNWWKPLRQAAQEHGVSLTEAITLVEVLHDDGCSRLEGTGTCDCNPDVKLASKSLEGGEA